MTTVIPDPAKPHVRITPAPAGVRRGSAWVVGMATVAFVLAGIGRAWSPHPDFEYFYKAGRSMLTDGSLDRGVDILPDGTRVERGSLPWYLPFVSRAMAPIAWLPYSAAGMLWVGLNTLALLTILRLLAQHVMGFHPQDWPVVQVVPLLLLAPAWWWEFRLNQVDTLALLLMVAAFVHWQRGWGGVGGFWLGLAVLLKLTPGLVLVWFVLKRQWRFVATALVTIVAAGPLSDVITLGPQGAREAYANWFDAAVVQGSHRGLILSDREMDWRNQASGAVLARWLSHTNVATRYDNDPRFADADAPRYINVLDLDRATVVQVQLAWTAVVLAVLIWLGRSPASRLNGWQLRLEWALFVLAMLWLMPVMRRYHVILALPAVSLLSAALHYAGHRGPWAYLTLTALALVLLLPIASLGLMLLGYAEHLEAAGGILFGTILLGLPLIGLLLWLRRDSAALPADPFAPAVEASQRPAIPGETPPYPPTPTDVK